MTALISLYVTLESYMLIYVGAGCYLSAVNTKQRCINDNTVANPDFAARSLLMHVLNVFGGSALSSFLMGESPALPLTNISHLLIALVTWGLVVFGPEEVFFSPFDHICPKLYLESMNEVWSMFKVITGVNNAAYIFGSSAGRVLMRFFVGVARGGGVQLVRDIRDFTLSISSERALLSSCVLTMASLLLTIEQRAIVFLILTTALIANKVCLVLHGESEGLNLKLARAATWMSLISLSLIILIIFISDFAPLVHYMPVTVQNHIF